MPRNGLGTFSLPAGQPVVTGTPISSTTFNALTSDIATALTASIAADGQTPITANLPMSNHKLTGLSAGNAAGDSLRFEQLFSQGAPAALASAATVDIGAQNSVAVEISGTTTITSLGANYNGPRYLRFTGILQLTHSASLNLPGAANITTAAGDMCIAYPNSASSGWNVTSYTVAALAPGVASTATTAGNVTGTVAVANGGTGATTAANALAALAGAPLASPTFTGTPTAPTAAYGTNTTQLATTAHALAAAKGTYSLGATSGYVIFANGLTIQYGVSSAGTSGTETYPTPFANNCVAVVWSNNNTNAAGYVTAKNTANFSWAISTSATINWIAIGY